MKRNRRQSWEETPKKKPRGEEEEDNIQKSKGKLSSFFKPAPTQETPKKTCCQEQEDRLKKEGRGSKGQYQLDQPHHLPTKSIGGGGADESLQQQLVHCPVDEPDVGGDEGAVQQPPTILSPYHLPIAHQEGGGEDNPRRENQSKLTSNLMGPQLSPYLV